MTWFTPMRPTLAWPWMIPATRRSPREIICQRPDRAADCQRVRSRKTCARHSKLLEGQQPNLPRWPTQRGRAGVAQDEWLQIHRQAELGKRRAGLEFWIGFCCRRFVIKRRIRGGPGDVLVCQHEP